MRKGRRRVKHFDPAVAHSHFNIHFAWIIFKNS